jgi:hypothetical protein
MVSDDAIGIPSSAPLRMLSLNCDVKTKLRQASIPGLGGGSLIGEAPSPGYSSLPSPDKLSKTVPSSVPFLATYQLFSFLGHNSALYISYNVNNCYSDSLQRRSAEFNNRAYIITA